MEIDNVDLIDIAKTNLSELINEKKEEYKKNKTKEIKAELLELLKDRDEIFLFNKDVIKKYV